MAKKLKTLTEKRVSKKLKRYLNELMAGGSSVDGAPSFRGGPYGVGNKKQLAAPLNPATKDMEDKEQAEVNKNVEDLHWKLGKYKYLAGSGKLQDIHSEPDNNYDTPALNKTEKQIETGQLEEEEELQERNSADALYSHLPGFPAMNALENPEIHIPDENLMVTDLRAGHQDDDSADYLIDDIIDELEELEELESEPELATEAGQGSANFDYTWPAALPPYEQSKHDGELGHAGMEPTDVETSAGPMGMGAVMHPKKFVPDGWPQESSLFDKDGDGIADNIDLDQPPELKQETPEEFPKLKKNNGKTRSQKR